MILFRAHYTPFQRSTGGHLPGVFFNYELSPIRVRIEEKRRPFLHFLTRVCAIVGGVFTIMGVVDRFATPPVTSQTFPRNTLLCSVV